MKIEARNTIDQSRGIANFAGRIHVLVTRAAKKNAPARQPMSDDVVSWNFKTVSQKRGMRVAGRVFHIARNVSAIAGLFFFYLLIHGYNQYAELDKASTQPCVVSRCS
ncbi:hypothetical protein AB4851_08640 [Burkholderia sp. 22PA0099]|uniref:hypothetical protein n=1 Tax=Burkholderia sp. 22PA0099 TaxID=3237372 RepID=UPI0039C4A0E5